MNRLSVKKEKLKKTVMFDDTDGNEVVSKRRGRHVEESNKEDQHDDEDNKDNREDNCDNDKCENNDNQQCIPDNNCSENNDEQENENVDNDNADNDNAENDNDNDNFARMEKPVRVTKQQVKKYNQRDQSRSAPESHNNVDRLNIKIRSLNTIVDKLESKINYLLDKLEQINTSVESNQQLMGAQMSRVPRQRLPPQAQQDQRSNTSQQNERPKPRPSLGPTSSSQQTSNQVRYSTSSSSKRK